MANPLNIFGIPIRHCINGITKDDKVNIDSIPSLDERIMALENDISNEWHAVDVSTTAKATALVPILFDYDGDHYITKYPMIVRYRTGLFYLKSGMDINSLSNDNRLRILYLFNSETATTLNEEVIDFEKIFFGSQDPLMFNYTHNSLTFNKSDNTFSYNTSSSVMYRNRISIFVKGYEQPIN